MKTNKTFLMVALLVIVSLGSFLWGRNINKKSWCPVLGYRLDLVILKVRVEI